MIRLTLMTRPGCRLCDEMKAVIREVRQRAGWHGRIGLTEIDISTDPELERTWGSEIPVLLCGGQEIARHRISAAQLAAAISPLP